MPFTTLLACSFRAAGISNLDDGPGREDGGGARSEQYNREEQEPRGARYRSLLASSDPGTVSACL